MISLLNEMIDGAIANLRRDGNNTAAEEWYREKLVHFALYATKRDVKCFAKEVLRSDESTISEDTIAREFIRWNMFRSAGQYYGTETQKTDGSDSFLLPLKSLSPTVFDIFNVCWHAKSTLHPFYLTHSFFCGFLSAFEDETINLSREFIGELVVKVVCMYEAGWRESDKPASWWIENQPVVHDFLINLMREMSA